MIIINKIHTWKTWVVLRTFSVPIVICDLRDRCTGMCFLLRSRDDLWKHTCLFIPQRAIPWRSKPVCYSALTSLWSDIMWVPWFYLCQDIFTQVTHSEQPRHLGRCSDTISSEADSATVGLQDNILFSCFPLQHHSLTGTDWKINLNCPVASGQSFNLWGSF